MRILLLSPFFYPEQISTGKYNTYLAEALAAAGHEVTVLASHPIYPNWRAEISNAQLPNIEIKRGGGWIAYPRSAMLRRAILELWFAWYVVSSYFRLRDRPDVVVPIFPPSLFFMLLHSLMPRMIRRVGIVHDLQGVYAARAGGLASRLVNKAIHFVEKRCFKGCDQLLFLSSSMAKRAIDEYQLGDQPFKVCYPFVAVSDGVGGGDALATVVLPYTLNVVYSGALGEKQNPEGLFTFMNEVASVQTKVACHIFSAGPLFEKLRSKNEGRPSCTVQFHDLVSVEQLPELYARSDVQIIPQALNTSDGSLPSKLPNLLAAGVPVFAICESGSELGDLVNEADAGVVVNSWNTTELVKVFNTYRDKLSAESKLDRRGRLKSFVKSKFSIDSVVNCVVTAEKR